MEAISFESSTNLPSPLSDLLNEYFSFVDSLAMLRTGTAAAAVPTATTSSRFEIEENGT